MAEYPLQVFNLFLIVFFPVLSFIVVVLRTWSRLSLKQFGWDDGLIILAMCIAIVEAYYMYSYVLMAGLGRHLWQLPTDADPVRAAKYNFLVEILYNPQLGIVKDSVLLFLLRLTGQKKNIRYTIYGLLTFNTSLLVAVFTVTIFQCQPVRYAWDQTTPGGKCIDTTIFFVITAIISIVTDIVVLGMPVWIVAPLKMTKKMKIAVMSVFFLGFLVTIVSVWRFVTLIQVFYGTPSSDPTYGIGYAVPSIENGLAITTASAPALKPLFRRFFPGFFSTYADPYVPTYDNTGPTRYGMGTQKSKIGRRPPPGAFELKDLPPGNDRTENRSHVYRGHAKETSAGGSQESILQYDGIVKTTNVSVRYTETGKSDMELGPQANPHAM